MRRWIGFAASFYPRSWREEYGREFDDLLDELKPGWRVFANILAGGIRMHLTTKNTWLKLAAAMGVAGLVAGWGASFAVPQHYVSSAVIGVTPRIDPLRPTSLAALQQRAAGRFAGMELEILSRISLSQIIRELDLYRRERSRMTLEAVIDQMRRDIRIQPFPATASDLDPIRYSVSFDYRDPAQAKATVRALANRFIDWNTVTTATYNTIYLNLWRDESMARHTKPAPPPPVQEIVAVVDPPSEPQRVGVDRIAFLASGLGAGLLLGLLAALAISRPRGWRWIAGFATAGGVLAFAVSFAIPVRYTSTAEMQITPAGLTEDPLATPPPPTPAAEFLRQLEPDVVSIQKLSWLIQDPRLELYPEERKRKPIEELSRTMLTRDLRIEPVNPPSGDTTPTNVFRISFSYPDRIKASMTVQAVVRSFADVNFARSRKDALQRSDTWRDILQRKAGENLDVLDPPSLPTMPDHSRWPIAAAGVGVGLLLGVIVLCLRRPRTPLLRPRGLADSTSDPPNQRRGPEQTFFSGLGGCGRRVPRLS